MEQDFPKSVFYRALMTSVFVGIIATVVTMVYDLVFVRVLGFPFSEIINVSTLIFGVNLIFLAVGFLYYLFVAFMRRGDFFFIILFVLLTAFFAWRAELTHRTDNEAVNVQFRQLLGGIVVIIGIMIFLVIPLLYHNKKFEKNVL